MAVSDGEFVCPLYRPGFPTTWSGRTRVLFGSGQLDHLHEQQLPGKKALLIISNGQSAKKYGYLERVEKELAKVGVEYALFDQVRPNPIRENVMDGAKAVKANGCDFVVALGGGSVMDCAKCIALMATNPGDIWDYSLSKNGGKKNAEFDAIPIVAITTSAGTGSEVDIAAVISDDEGREKTGIFFPSIFPTLSIVDAGLMMSVPPKFTAYQGMDAFFHASESVINKNEDPMGEMFALKAIEHVMGSFHEDLVHGAGLIMTAHAYYDFFAERKAAEEPMIKMARAMGVEHPASSVR